VSSKEEEGTNPSDGTAEKSAILEMTPDRE
jgi:hypothetical protein